ncbi:DUF6907 domain-containing protein [Streptomyces stelliscabiei]|uniref:DUF6907 domain-containing protein n=1 Tax=Streptomyces stelliscabiei TaxID=146820 RepID=UPI0029AF9158|nr:hypothetical protein [Streptomyces stelliscabiei]MDX2552772.1 hypothetical protein [Streptomyces stelliscabiei]
MSTEPRTITLPTADHGPVTLDEPTWCMGHSHHDPNTERVDLIHSGPDIQLNFRYVTLLSACLVQSPYAGASQPSLGGRTPGVSVHPLGLTLDATQVYDLAARLDTFADRLRDLADQLAGIRAGGGGR